MINNQSIKNWSILHDLFGAVWEVFLDLVVGEFEDLQAVWEGGLRRLGFSEVVDNFLVWEGLLDVRVVEVDDRVAVGEAFSLHAVVEDYFLFAVGVHALDLAIVPDYLLHYFLVSCRLLVVLFGELEAEVFLFLFVVLVAGKLL